MSGWAMVVVVAIVVWGIVQMRKGPSDELSTPEADEPGDKLTQQEIEELRERIQVLERIATEGNSLDAKDTKQIAAEIEALRDKQIR